MKLTAKLRLRLVTLMLVVSSLSTASAMAQTSGTVNNNKPDSFSTPPPPVSTPVPQPQPAKPLSGKVIMIDPGHGGADSGAQRGTISEKDLTLSISLKLKADLEAKGATVILTRSSDATVSLEKRVDLCNTIKPDIFVAVHVNANLDVAESGIETYYYNADGERLARPIFDALVKELHEQANWVRWDELYVLHHNDRVAALVEVGYLSNAPTRAKLVSDPYQVEIAQAIADGIERYFDNISQPAPSLVPAPPKSKLDMMPGSFEREWQPLELKPMKPSARE